MLNCEIIYNVIIIIETCRTVFGWPIHMYVSSAQLQPILILRFLKGPKSKTPKADHVILKSEIYPQSYTNSHSALSGHQPINSNTK